MKSMKRFSSHVLCIVISASYLLSACKRDIPPLPTSELRNVTFKLRGFEAETMPMDGPRAAERVAIDGIGNGVQALRDIEPSPEPQYLYYWSFNDETLEPDIAVDGEGAGITFEANNEIADYYGGFKLEPYEAGQAMSLRGASILEISLPLSEVESLTYFEFDISSSNTGPKDFRLSYSIDGGNTYETLSGSNQFEKLGEQSRNSFRFDVSDSLQFIGIDFLKIKFDFLAGDRPLRPGDEGDDPLPWEYNESTGPVRLDNIRLSGVYNGEASDPTHPNTLHYYIFSADDGSVVQQEELAMSALSEGNMLDVKLADGDYDVLFVAYRSEKGVLLPANLTHASEFYFSQHFDDHRAITYAALLEGMTVDGDDAEVGATLTRCYSLIEFDFTDLAADLQRVETIEIVRKHDDFHYTPFGLPNTVGTSDAERIEFSNFSSPEDYQLALHQFFGLPEGVSSITYEVTAYGEDGAVLNTVTISQSIRNNVRLRLRGRLLGDTGAINGFSIALDTEWGESLDHEF